MWIVAGLDLIAGAYQRVTGSIACLERLNRELKHGTRVATLFPNEAALLRLVTGVAIEISDECVTTKRYVTFEAK
jgi:transposase-like protein